MYKNIIVPVALDHGHDPAEAIAVAKALLADGGKITLLSVVEPVPGYIATYIPEGQLEKKPARDHRESASGCSRRREYRHPRDHGAPRCRDC